MTQSTSRTLRPDLPPSGDQNASVSSSRLALLLVEAGHDREVPYPVGVCRARAAEL